MKRIIFFILWVFCFGMLLFYAFDGDDLLLKQLDEYHITGDPDDWSSQLERDKK